MPSFKPIESANDLPAIGVAVEHETLDLKVTYSPTKGEEMAKDMAAFANHLGGVILIGATEAESRLSGYEPLPLDVASKLKANFENAARNLCSPTPLVFVQLIDHGSGVLLAVNIEPTTHTVVGVHYGRDAYHFPVRRASQTVTIKPEDLPMYMLPELRRKVLLLERAKAVRNITLRYWYDDAVYLGQNPHRILKEWRYNDGNVYVSEVSVEDNKVSFCCDEGTKIRRIDVTLDSVDEILIVRPQDVPINQARVNIRLKESVFA